MRHSYVSCMYTDPSTTVRIRRRVAVFSTPHGSSIYLPADIIHHHVIGMLSEAGLCCDGVVRRDRYDLRTHRDLVVTWQDGSKPCNCSSGAEAVSSAGMDRHLHRRPAGWFGEGSWMHQHLPLPCSDVLVAFPYQLDFGSDAGKILDGNGVGTGFTMVGPPTNGTGYLPANLAIDTAAGTLKITTTKGTAFNATDSQDNTLGIGIDAPDHISVLETSIINPPAGTGSYEQAGALVREQRGQLRQARRDITPTGTKIQHLIEVNGAQANSRNTAVLNLTGATVSLTLRANPYRPDDCRLVQGQRRHLALGRHVHGPGEFSTPTRRGSIPPSARGRLEVSSPAIGTPRAR